VKICYTKFSKITAAISKKEGDGQTATELLRAARNRDEAMLEQTHERSKTDE
jgi:hypothetical protein